MLTQTELKYFIALQPEFKKRMGKKACGDAYYCQHHNKVMYWLSYIDQCDECIIPLNSDCAMRIWLPSFVDYDQSERGLWGMIDHKKFNYISDRNGLWLIKHRPLNEFDFNDFRARATPTEAVLRALASQWRIEVIE